MIHAFITSRLTAASPTLTTAPSQMHLEASLKGRDLLAAGLSCSGHTVLALALVCEAHSVLRLAPIPCQASGAAFLLMLARVREGATSRAQGGRPLSKPLAFLPAHEAHNGLIQAG